MQYVNRSLDDLVQGQKEGRKVVFDGLDVSYLVALKLENKTDKSFRKR
jgi:hypothetical protein